MTDEQANALFRTVADHLESLAISIQNVEELYEHDRVRMEADRARMEADHSRLDRLERLFKLMIRIGDRERKDLRHRINALIDAQIRSEMAFTAFQAQMAETQKKADERLTQFQAQVAETQKKADERTLRLEESNAQFQTQIGKILSQLAEATAFAHRRLDAIEANE